MTRVTIELIGPSDLDVGEGWPELDQALGALGLSVEVRSRRPRRATPSEGLEICGAVARECGDARSGCSGWCGRGCGVDAPVALAAAQTADHGDDFGPDGKPLKQVKLPEQDHDTSA